MNFKNNKTGCVDTVRVSSTAVRIPAQKYFIIWNRTYVNRYNQRSDHVTGIYRSRNANTCVKCRWCIVTLEVDNLNIEIIKFKIDFSLKSYILVHISNAPFFKKHNGRYCTLIVCNCIQTWFFWHNWLVMLFSRTKDCTKKMVLLLSNIMFVKYWISREFKCLKRGTFYLLKPYNMGLSVFHILWKKCFIFVSRKLDHICENIAALKWSYISKIAILT